MEETVPGLNAVIRAVVKRASQEKDWEVIGSIESYNGVLREPTEIMVLDEHTVEEIHIQGGTILGTTTKGGPFAWPIKNQDGSWDSADRSDEMLRKFQFLGGGGCNKHWRRWFSEDIPSIV